MKKFSAEPSNFADLLEMVGDGSAIFLAPGEYKGPFAIAKSITLTGAGADTIIFTADEPALTIKVPGVRIENLAIERTVGGDVGATVVFAEPDAAPILNRVRLTGVAENVEWEGATWDLPTVIDLQEIETNRALAGSWEIQLAEPCKAVCELDWLQIKGDRFSPGWQKLEILLNSTGIPPGTNLSGFILLEGAGEKRQIEVSAKIIAPKAIAAAEKELAPSKKQKFAALGCQDWGYKFMGKAAESFIRAVGDGGDIDKDAEFWQKRDRAEALMFELLGSEGQLFYIRRQKPGKEEDEEIWELTLATDGNDAAWPETLRKRDKTLSLVAAVNTSGYGGLRIISTRLLLPHRGQPDGFTVRFRLRLVPEKQYQRGIPKLSLKRVSKAEFASDRLPTEEQLQGWTTFVEIERRQAEKRQYCVPFLSHNYGTSSRKITIEIDIAAATLDGTAETAIDEEDFRRRLFQSRNEDINFFDAKADPRERRDRQKLGWVERIDWEESKIQAMLDAELVERLARGKAKLPATGFLFFEAYGEIAQIKRKQRALEDLKKGRSQNPYLGEFFFDVASARLPKKNVKLEPGDLLLPSANPQQIAAVETVLSVPDLALIQGPPGTGKTTVIAEICYQVALRGGRTLIASQANLAVDNALSRLVSNPIIRALRKGKAEKVQEEGEAFLEDRVIGTWLKNTADYCETDIQGRGRRVELFEKLLAVRPRFAAYLELEEEKVKEDRESSDRLINIEANRKALETELAEIQSGGEELKSLISALERFFASGPDVDWEDEEVTGFLPRLQPYAREEKAVDEFLANVREARDLARQFGLEVPDRGAFGLAGWLSEEVTFYLERFGEGLELGKTLTAGMSPALAAVELWQENEAKFQELQSKYQQQQAACEQLQQSLQKLERKKADLDLVVRASGSWFETGKNRIYQVLWQCQENERAFSMDLIELPAALLAIARSLNIEILPNYGDIPINKLADWTLLQVALNAEASRNFSNVKGKRYRFSEFLHLNLSKAPLVLSLQERSEWQKIAEQFLLYPDLELKEREAVIKKTRRFLNQMEAKYRPAWEPNNLQATLMAMMENIFDTILDNTRRCLAPMKQETEGKIEIFQTKIKGLSGWLAENKEPLAALEEQLLKSREDADGKYGEIRDILQQLSKEKIAPEKLRDLAGEYLQRQPLEVLNQRDNFSGLVDSWESATGQLQELIPGLEPLSVLSDIQTKLQSQEGGIGEKVEEINRQIQELETEAVEINKGIEEGRSPALIAERSWWESAWKEIPDNLKPEVSATGLFAIEFLRKFETQFENWQEELEGEESYLNRYQNFVEDWVAKLRQPSEKDSNDLRRIYLDNANAIGITCVQAASKEFAEEFNNFDVVIIDEVSKCTPPEMLIPALKGKKLVLVGDHRQLPPMLNAKTMEEIAEETGSAKEELDFFEESLFKIHFEAASEKVKQMLTVQYRMHPNIMGAINQFYDRRLQCGILEPDKERFHGLAGELIEDKHHLLWVKMPQGEGFFEQKEGTSPYNEREVEAIEKLCVKMEAAWSGKVAEGLPRKEVGIITFYNAQLRLIEEKIDPELFPSLQIRTGTVDRFQGMERQVIIVSMVRNNKERKVGFANKPERVNVAFSRARELLVIVGCHSLFTQHYGKVGSMYSEVSNVVRRQGGLVEFADI